ncbi:MAG: hypothetical protein V5A59_10160 [Bacteroidales bacterium]|nr:hypothetical protein [Bacteroidales bacterium]
MRIAFTNARVGTVADGVGSEARDRPARRGRTRRAFISATATIIAGATRH